MRLYTQISGYAGSGIRTRSGCNCRPRKPRMNRAAARTINNAIDRALAEHDSELIANSGDSKPLVPRDVFDKPRKPVKQESTALIPRGWQS